METRETLELQFRKIEDRTVEWVISDGTIDSYGTILSPGGWDLRRFSKSGVLFYQHAGMKNNDPDVVLGPATAYQEGNLLIGRATFETEDINPLAEKIFRKVKNKTLKGVSVGFIPKKQHRDGDVIVFDEMELYEFSVVHIPSNPNALRRSFSEKDKKNRQLNILNYM